MRAPISLTFSLVCALGLVPFAPERAHGLPDPPRGKKGVLDSAVGYMPWAEAPPQSGSTGGAAGSAQPHGTGAAETPDCTKVPLPKECLDGDNKSTAMGFVNGPETPARMAVFALRELLLPLPGMKTAPPRGEPGAVGLRHFFWADRSRWRALRQRAQAGAVWAEVTAVPSRLVIRPGDGRVVTCEGPGKPYDFSRSPDRQDTTCTYVYERSSAGFSKSAYRASADVVWTATWIGSGGSGGTLPSITRSESFPVRIAEVQALVQRSR